MSPLTVVFSAALPTSTRYEPMIEHALYAQARLELELGHTGRARTLLERYLARYPSGVNAEDARALLRRLR